MLATDFGCALGSTDDLQHNLRLELGAEISSLAHSALLLLNSVPCLVPLSNFGGALQCNEKHQETIVHYVQKTYPPRINMFRLFFSEQMLNLIEGLNLMNSLE